MAKTCSSHDMMRSLSNLYRCCQGKNSTSLDLANFTSNSEANSMLVSVCKIAHFNAAHRLHNPTLTDSENLEIFGKCNNANYHGHNYTLEVWVKGPINPKTGYVMDLKLLKDLIEQEIENRFDHKNLNLDTVEFKTLNPTAENICVVCWNLLRTKIDPTLQLKIRLYETERNVVEYAGDY